MGFRTQRQYTTTIVDYDDFKEAVQKSNLCRIRQDSKGNFTFYLRAYPDVRIQLTSKNFFLKLHGVKPFEFLLDLNVIRKLCSLLKEFYPDGIYFKLHKENIGYYDKDQIINRDNGIFELQQKLLNRLKDSPEEFEKMEKDLCKSYESNPQLHNHFAKTMNDVFVYGLSKFGFKCYPDGTLKAMTIQGDNQINGITAQWVEIIAASGFLDD